MMSSEEGSQKSSISYQLTHSVVEPFKPRIDCLFVNLNGNSITKHICQQCFDTFLFESSLKTHLERRSVKISYFCDKCKSALNFYNRCALLSHIRSHNHNNSHNNCDHKLEVSQVFVSPLPLTQLLPERMATNDHFLNKTKTDANNVNSNSIYTNDEKTCIKSISDNYKTIESIRSDTNSMAEPLIDSRNDRTKESVKTNTIKEQNNVNNNINDNNMTTNICNNNLIKKKILIKKSTNSELKCSECNASLSSLSTREEHFVRNEQMVLPSNQCKICPIICPTKCSQTVHNRLHYNNNNRFCPECGAKCHELKDTDFMTHIIINCLHFSRRLVYECIFCNNRLSSLSSFIQHIKSFHTTQHFQCSQCLFKYETDSQLKEHQTNSHPNDLRRNVLFKCPLCETELKSSNTYLEHISNHQKKLFGFAKFIFICHECNHTFVNKNDLKLHLNSFHTQNKNELERKAFFSKLTKEIWLQFRLNVNIEDENTSNNKPNNQNSDYSIVKSNNEKRDISHLNSDQINTNDSSVKRQMTESLVINNNQSLNNQSPNNLNMKENETNVNTQKPSNPKLLNCKECGLNFPVLQTLKRHLILEHRIHNVENYINKINAEIPVVITEPQLPKEVGEEKLSEILDNKESTDTTCPICSLKFSDSKELKIHGRVHGMAFIKSCQKKTTSK